MAKEFHQKLNLSFYSFNPELPISKFNMKIILSTCLFLFLSDFITAQSKTLGDWATFHREADNLCKKSKYEDAVTLYKQVIKGRLPFQGNRHRDVGVAWNNLGVALYYLGENEQAQEAYEKGKKILLPAVGANHPDILSIETNNIICASFMLQV